MDKKVFSVLRPLLWLVIAVAAVLLVAAVFDAAAHAIVGYAASSKDVKYTAGHFVPPALPSGWIGLSFVLLLPLMAVFARFAGEEPAEKPSSMHNSAAGGLPRAGKILAGEALQ